MTLRVTSIVFGVSIGLAPTVASQSPQQIDALAAWDDSLGNIRDRSRLTVHLETVANSARSTDPLVQVRRGLVLLRAGELGIGRDDLDGAESAFDEAAYRAPDDWPWPWYGLARAKLLLDARGAPARATMHQHTGDTYRNAALRMLAKSLEADPQFEPAAELLAATLIPLGDRDIGADTRRAVYRAARTGLPAPMLVLGRMYRNIEHPDSALAAFSEYVRVGGDSGIGLLEQARVLQSLDRIAEARVAYLAGARVADAATRSAYRGDLVWIAAPSELAAFDSLPTDSLGRWVASFWSNRDATELRAPGERLAEHLRRWNFVYRAYRLPPLPDSRSGIRTMSLPGERDYPASVGPGASPDVGPGYGMPEPEAVAPPTESEVYRMFTLPGMSGARRIVDDRAVVYMRHGEPDALVATVSRADNIPGGINWKYNTTAGPLLYHFRCHAYCVLELLPVSLDGMIDLDTRFERLAMSLRRGRADSILIRKLIRERRTDIARGLSSDGFSPRFKQQLEPIVQVFATGGLAARSGRALVVFALPGERLAPTPLPAGGVTYPVVLRIIATDVHGEIRRLDTTRVFRTADTLREGAYISGLAELALGAGTWDVRAIFSQPDAGTGGAMGRLGVVVPDAAGLSLSDLVFGRAGAGLTWQSPTGPVPLNPLDVYPRGGAVELYYEAHGLTAGRRYRSTIGIRGVAGDAKGEVGIAFEEAATEPNEAFRRRIDLARLRGGQYRLTLTLEEIETGTKVSRDRLINVLGK